MLEAPGDFRIVLGTDGIIDGNAEALKKFESSIFFQTELDALLERPGSSRIDGTTIDEILASQNPRSFVIGNAANHTIVSGLSASRHAGGVNSVDVSNIDNWIASGNADEYRRMLDEGTDALHHAINDVSDILQNRYGNFVSAEVLSKLPNISGGKALPVIGWGFTILASLSVAQEARAAEAAGDLERAKEIWAEFTVGELGGEIAGTVGGAVGGLLALTVLGLSAPVAAVAGVALAVVGGIYGEDFAKELYQLTKDMDGNQRMDLVDRLATFAFGQDFQPKNLPEALSQNTVTLTAEMPVAELVEKAKTDIAYRYALRELMPVIAAGASEEDFAPFNQDGSLNLFDADHPQGMTDAYIQDRAFMLVLQMRYLKNGLKLNRDLVDDLISGDWDYIDFGQHPFAGDVDRPLEFSIDGNGVTADNHRIAFGSGKDDVLEGGGRDDRLYGAGGDDTLKGDKGDDHMEGGAGHDAYHIQDHDTILDTDGQGKLLFADGHRTIEARQFMAVAPDAQVWKSVDVVDNTFDNQFRAWRESDDLHIIRLNADGTDSADQATIRHYFLQEKALGQGKVLGIMLRDYQNPDSIPGNAQTLEMHANERYHNIFNLQDDSYILYGGQRHDTVFAQGAQTGASGYALRANLGAGDDIAFGSRYADIVFGGEGTDLLSGSSYMRGADGRSDKEKALDADYLAGGAGADFIHGYAGNDIIHSGDPGEHENPEAANTRGDWATGGEGDDHIPPLHNINPSHGAQRQPFGEW